MNDESPSAEDVRPPADEGIRPRGSATTTLARVLAKEPALRWRVATLAVLVVLAAALYRGSLTNGFVWDDWDHLFQPDEWGRNLVPNEDITSLRGALGSLKDLDSGAREPSRQVFRPLRTLSFAADYARARLDPRRLHGTNLLLHILTVLAAYLAIRGLGGGFFVSVTAAGFFALHPVHTEAVDHIANRADLLAAPLLFLALGSYAKRRKGAGPLSWLPAVTLYLAAVLCKETAVVFPIALLLYDWVMPPKGLSSRRHLRTRLVPYSAFAITCALYLVARRAAMGPPEHPELWGGSHSATALMMVQALARYARLVFFPLRLSARHEIPPVQSLLAPEFVGGTLVVVAATVAALWAFRRSPVAAFGIGWFFIFLLPVSNVVIPIPGAMLAEHWLYLPAFGMAALFGWALGGIVRRVYRTGSTLLFIIAAALLLAVMAFFGTRTALRHEVWRDDEMLFTSILEERPGDTDVRLGLGRHYWLSGRLDKAEIEYRQVVELEPRRAEARFRLGEVARLRGHSKDARQHLSKAVELDPGHYRARYALAATLDAAAASLDDSARALEKGAEEANGPGKHAAGLKRREAAALKSQAARQYREFLSLVESTGARVPLPQRSRARSRLQALEGPGAVSRPRGKD